MRDRLARLSASSDEGMTLVEVMVAMLVLTVVFSAMASVLITSLHSLVGNENRVRANALANELLEDLQERRWAYVGFAESDFDASVPADTVIVDDALADYDDWLADDARAQPSAEFTRDGTTYTVETAITWGDDTATETAHDYKRFVVDVGWEEFGRERTTSHAAQRTPSSNEADSGLTIRSITVNPSWSVLEDEGADPTAMRDVSEPVEVIVRVNGLYDSLTLEIGYPDGSTGGQTLHNVGPSEYSTQLFDLATYHGETTFRVIGERDGNEVTKSSVAHYVHREVDVGAIELSDGACVTENAEGELVLDAETELSVHVDGTIHDDVVLVTPELGDGQFEAGHVETTSRGSHWMAVLPAGVRVPPGEGAERPNFTVSAQRAYNGPHADAGTSDSATIGVDRCSG